AARDDDRARPMPASRLAQPGDQRKHYLVLKTRDQIDDSLIGLGARCYRFNAGLANVSHHRRLESAEAEVETCAFHARQRENKLRAFGVAASRESIDDRSSGVTEAKHLCHLVEGFAGGVVSRAAKHSIDSFFGNQKQGRVSS